MVEHRRAMVHLRRETGLRKVDHGPSRSPVTLAARSQPHPRPQLRDGQKKKARDRLIRLAESHPEWVLGYQDETWWSRLAIPAMHAWADEGRPLRLVEQAVPKT